jgi:putative glutamine amidotransferase
MSLPANPSRKPLIGCTTYNKTADQDPPVNIIGLMPAYVKAVEAAGGLPVLIPLGLSEADLYAIFERLDGLLLPGGGDIDPAVYGGQMNPTIWGVDEDRDRVELLLARKAATSTRPVLAICRGHQIFNVALGGTLWTDILTERPDSLKHDYYKIRPRNELIHDVTIQPDSLLARSLGTTQTMVNSLHHQAVRRLAPDLRVVATAPDGLIEGAELPGHPFALSVQWHPENLIDDDPAMLDLFRAFVRAAANGSRVVEESGGRVVE